MVRLIPLPFAETEEDRLVWHTVERRGEGLGAHRVPPRETARKELRGTWPMIREDIPEGFSRYFLSVALND